MIFTPSSLQVTIVKFWIEFDLIFAFFFMEVITMVFWIQLDNISAFFCVQVITMVLWIVLDFIFVCMQVTSMAFCSELPGKNSNVF